MVFTLSSIPPRFSRIGPTLESLLAQSMPADRICLYIPERYRRFPDWDGTLPKVPNGVEIVRVPQDFGPATKVLPAVQAFRGQDVDILFCDDDRVYAPTWAAEFLNAGRDHPGCAIAKRGLFADGIAGTTSVRDLQPRAKARNEKEDFAFRVRRALRRLAGKPAPERKLFRSSGYIDIFEGCSGVLVRPDYFDDTAFDVPEEAWSVDDVWLSGMLAKNGVPIWLVANTVTPSNTAAQAEAPLALDDRARGGRGATNRRAVLYLQDRYGVWL